jgi:hypothetical protein
MPTSDKPFHRAAAASASEPAERCFPGASGVCPRRLRVPPGGVPVPALGPKPDGRCPMPEPMALTSWADDAEIAGASCSPAARGGAHLVAGDHVRSEVARRTIFVAAVIEELPGDRVGDQTAPGTCGVGGEAASNRCRDRAMSGQLAGLLIKTEQRGHGHRHLDRRPHALRLRQQRVGQGGYSEIDQGVGATLIGRAQVVAGRGRGKTVDSGQDCGGAFGWQQRPQLGHAVVTGRSGICGARPSPAHGVPRRAPAPPTRPHGARSL